MWRIKTLFAIVVSIQFFFNNSIGFGMCGCKSFKKAPNMNFLERKENVYESFKKDLVECSDTRDFIILLDDYLSFYNEPKIIEYLNTSDPWKDRIIKPDDFEKLFELKALIAEKYRMPEFQFNISNIKFNRGLNDSELCLFASEQSPEKELIYEKCINGKSVHTIILKIIDRSIFQFFNFLDIHCLDKFVLKDESQKNGSIWSLFEYQINVSEVDLSEYRSQGNDDVLEQILGKLTGLKSICLHKVNLLPKEWVRVLEQLPESIEVLDLSKSNYNGENISSFKRFSNLKSIKLDHLYFEDIENWNHLIGSFHDSLKSIYLQKTNWNGSGIDTLLNKYRMKKVYLAPSSGMEPLNDYLKVNPSEELEELVLKNVSVNVDMLDLSRCINLKKIVWSLPLPSNYTGWGDCIHAFPKSLEKISLGGSDYDGSSPDVFRSFKHLVYLKLRKCPISEVSSWKRIFSLLPDSVDLFVVDNLDFLVPYNLEVCKKNIRIAMPNSSHNYNINDHSQGYISISGRGVKVLSGSGFMGDTPEDSDDSSSTSA